MISTLTLSTVVSVMSGTFADVLATICILLLLVLLFQKELATAAGPRFQSVTRVMNVAIVPLLVVFMLVVLAKGFAAIP